MQRHHGTGPVAIIERTEGAAPLSPHRAAALEGDPLDIPQLLEWLEALRANTVLIEGVGGWMVPLCSGPPPYHVADLAQDIGAPIILVAVNRLGVLNHTLLTIEAIRRTGLPVVGVVLNTTQEIPELSLKTNLADLRELLNVPVIEAPQINPADPGARKALGEHLWRSLNLSC